MTNNNQSFAMIFPGQGSQRVGMLHELAQHYKIIQHTFDQASDLLDYDIWKLCQQDVYQQLNQTVYTQPALLTAGVALYRAWRKHQGAEPLYMAGHSLGEYTALICAEALTFEEGLLLVADRGRYMQEGSTGGMGVILGLENNTVKQLCLDEAKEAILTPANYNAYGQVVVAGEIEAVKRALQRAKEMGAKLVKLLPISVPSHCPLMKNASEQLAKRLGDVTIRAPRLPVVNNVDATIGMEPALIKDALVRQLANPVRWVEVIEQLIAKGINDFIECGPGKVLQGLNRHINRNLQSIGLEEDFKRALATFPAQPIDKSPGD